MKKKMNDDYDTQGWQVYSETDIFIHNLSTKTDSTFLEDNLAICTKSYKGGHILWASRNRTILKNNGRTQNGKDC